MKSFKDFTEDMTTTVDAGIPHDTKDMMPKKKKKHKILTRSFIEIMGKRRKVTK